MKYLNELENVEGLGARAEDNAELTEQRLWYCPPSKVGGVATTIVGPPNSGTWAVDELWWDANRAKFRCTEAGTPGTWTQVEPAVLDGFQEGCPDNYWIIRRDKSWWQYRYDATEDNWDNISGKLDVPFKISEPVVAWNTWVTNGDKRAMVNISLHLFAFDSAEASATLIIEDGSGTWTHVERVGAGENEKGFGDRLLCFPISPGARWKIQNTLDPQYGATFEEPNKIVSVRIYEF